MDILEKLKQLLAEAETVTDGTGATPSESDPGTGGGNEKTIQTDGEGEKVTEVKDGGKSQEIKTAPNDPPPVPSEPPPSTEGNREVVTGDGATITPAPDITVIESGDLLRETTDAKFAQLYKAQEELETTLKLVLSELDILKKQFTIVSSPIDIGNDPNRDVFAMEQLINMI